MIILLLLVLLSAIWVWFGVRLKKIEQQQKEVSSGSLIRPGGTGNNLIHHHI